MKAKHLHHDRFCLARMNKFMPNWRLHRDVLNRAPLFAEGEIAEVRRRLFELGYFE